MSSIDGRNGMGLPGDDGSRAGGRKMNGKLSHGAVIVALRAGAADAVELPLHRVGKSWMEGDAGSIAMVLRRPVAPWRAVGIALAASVAIAAVTWFVVRPAEVAVQTSPLAGIGALRRPAVAVAAVPISLHPAELARLPEQGAAMMEQMPAPLVREAEGIRQDTRAAAEAIVERMPFAGRYAAVFR